MKALQKKHNLYGFITFLGLAAMLGIAGSSDLGLFESSALLFTVMGLFLTVTLAAMFLFRASGALLARKRAAIRKINRTNSKVVPIRRAA